MKTTSIAGSSCKARNAGFTLAETLVVILIVCILAAVAVPSIIGLVDSSRLKSSIDLVKRQIAVAKSRSVANPQIHCGVYFKLTLPQAVGVFYDNGNLSNVNRFVQGQDEFYIHFVNLSTGTSLALPVSNAVTDSCIVFRGDGSAKNGGSILIKDVKNRAWEINVLASTGRIKITRL